MTRTEFKRRLPGYIATGLVILITSFWTFWGVGEMSYEGWGTPFPESLFYLIPGMVCLVLSLVVLTWPRFAGWLLILIGGAFTAWWWTLAARRGISSWTWFLSAFPASGLLIVNVAHWEGKLLLLTPTIALADFGLSFLLATLAAGAGVLISLRSHTVQEAMQTLTAVLLLPPMLLGMFMTLLQDRVREFIGAFKGEQILLIVVAILAVIDVVVFVAAMARFQRSRLYLD